MNTYLLEIGLEEMPAQMILPAVEQLKSLVFKTCENNRLSFDELNTFSTPRRLAVQIKGLPDKQEDRRVDLKGPPAAIAKDKDNKWTKAALGFASKNGFDPADLQIRQYEGKDYLFVQRMELGQPVPELLQEQLEQWISQLNFPKNMRWASYQMRFIRPIRWIVSLWNNTVVPLKLEMTEAGNETRGHRFLSSGKSLLKDAADYQQQLEKLNVMPDYEMRRESITSQISKLELEFGFVVELDEKLLTEVTNLVEWPTVLLGDFEEEFLDLPNEVLVTSMAVHQRYFPVFRKNENQDSTSKTLLPHFVTVRNGNSKGLDTVRRGNAKVLRARLSDARFFYFEDQKKALDEFLQKAKNVVFFQKRGSQGQRVQRIAEFSVIIAGRLKLSEIQQKHVRRIAELSKFDLETQLVQEFPELQGLMGENYAMLKNENAVVCRGIRQHYFPRNAKDFLPEDTESVPTALADKLDLLVTAFSLNMIPSGAADPYALRRTAQGIIQLILGLRLPLVLRELISDAVTLLDDQQNLSLERTRLQNDLLEFLLQRQRWFLQERGIRYDLIDAVLRNPAVNLSTQEKTAIPALAIEQLSFAEFLGEHLETDIFKRSVEAIVRAGNISAKYSDRVAEELNVSALELTEEKNFLVALQPILNSDSKSLWSPDNYMQQLCEIEPVVTRFFEDVMVMDEDPVKCGNRLWLCQQLAQWSGRHLDLQAIVFA
ncbi:MAG: glycine--tRNA ligase subunit beta [bacterium]